MTLLRMYRAELRKMTTLPATLIAVAISMCGTLGLTLLNTVGIKSDLENGRLDQLGYTSPIEAVFSSVPLGTIGAIVIGVIIVSHEYTPNSTDAGGGRQMSASLVAAPDRVRLLWAKVLVTISLVGCLALIAASTAMAAAHLVLEGSSEGEYTSIAARTVGLTVYWILTALISLAFTALTRSAIAPLIVMITGSSVVSISVLLIPVTSLAFYLPDLAGIRMFTSESVWEYFHQALPPIQGGLVMAAWAAGLLVIAGIAFTRRDA